MFGIPADDLSSKVSKYPAHFFAGSVDGILLMANDLQAEFLTAGFSSDNIIGKNIFKLALRICLDEVEAKKVIANNNIIR